MSTLRCVPASSGSGIVNNHNKPARSNGWLERAAWPFAIVTTAVSLACLQFTVTAPSRSFSFNKLALFEATEPFQHRALMPAIVAALRQVVPASDALPFGALQWLGWIALIWLAYRALVVFGVSRSDLIRRTRVQRCRAGAFSASRTLYICRRHSSSARTGRG